jgi:hypothetical protein
MIAAARRIRSMPSAQYGNASAPSSPTELEHLAGTIERVTSHSPESGFAVL